MNINHEIVLEIAEKTKCPIMEMFYTPEDDRWYVCFEEDIVIKGEGQLVHLDDVLEEIKKYDNVEYIINEVYEDDEEDSYFEQVTFQWKE